MKSLLNLLGVDADPIRSREHILLSTILDTSWQHAQDLDLAGFIQAIQSLPWPVSASSTSSPSFRPRIGFPSP